MCGGGWRAAQRRAHNCIILYYYYLFCVNKGTMRLRAECGRARARLGGIIIIIILCVYRGKASRTRRHRQRAGCITSIISVGGGCGGRVCKGGAIRGQWGSWCGGRGVRARRNPWRLIDRSRKHANDKRARAFFVKTKTEKKKPTLESQRFVVTG